MRTTYTNLAEQATGGRPWGIQLLDQAGQQPSVKTPGWLRTHWGRVVIGVALSQAIFHGLQELWLAGFLAMGDGAAISFRTTIVGLLLIQAAQAAGLILGGMVTGASLRQGVLLGAIVGVWNGIISILMQRENLHSAGAMMLISEPILQSAFGAVGGLLGSKIWKPTPELFVSAAPSAVPQKVAKPRGPSPFAGPINWGRVMAGTTIAVLGTLWANVIFDSIVEATDGKLDVDTNPQAQLITWEITAWAMVAGAALAGTNTRNGPKQGLCMGLASAVILAGCQFGKSSVDVFDMLLTSGAAIVLGLAGGWFGGKLFPPVVRSLRRSRLYDTHA